MHYMNNMVMGITENKQRQLARRLLKQKWMELWEECIPLDLIVLGAERMSGDEHFSYYALSRMTHYIIENVGCDRELADEVTRECFHDWLEGK